MLDLIIIIKAIILGVIEGLTEFIPVSSTAHLLLASHFLDFSYIKNNVFEIVIQLGAISAVCFFYRKKILKLTLTSHKEKSSFNFSLNIILAFLPAMIIGALFHNQIKYLFSSQIVISLALIIGGIIIIVVERLNLKPKYYDIENISKSQAILIGIFQATAMIPGISRAGATIVGALLLKLNRKSATEFSFFLAIPTIFAATIFDLYKNYQFLDWSNYQIILIGFIAAFISSLLVIKWLLNFVSNHNFIPFAYYRIIIGLLVLALTL